MNGLKEGRRLRDDGIAKVSEGFDWWLNWARATAVAICREQGQVTSDEIHIHCPMPDGSHPNLMGAVFKDRRFKQAGFTQSNRPSAHGRVIRIYCL